MLNSRILIQGKQYRISGTIGKGATGIVYLAKDQHGSSFALKTINNYDDIFVKAMIDTEIKMQKQFEDSSYIIQCIGLQKNKKNVYIVLQLGECSLRHWAEASRQIQQKQLLTMICNVCQGLSAIHSKNIIHRDIKPQNIIKKGSNYKISDFGSCSDGNQNELMVGTALYWPPEILLNQSERITNKVDVWSFGISIFEVYFKIHPFCPEKKLAKIITMKQLKTQLLLNISELTPNFNIKKFVSFLNKNNLREQAQYVERKIISTTPSLIQILCNLLEPNPDLRLTVNQISKLFEYSISKLANPTISKTKKIPLYASILPQDIQLFCNTKDMVYQANYYGLSKHYDQVILSLEQSIFQLQKINYQGTIYIQFDKIQQIKKYSKRPFIEIQKQMIRSNLSQYYFYLQYDTQAKKYYKAKQLRRFILVCSVWFRIIRDSSSFCKMVSRISELEVQYPLRIFEYIKLISQKNLNQIQNKIVTKYYV